jgi:coatomer subunit beta'
VRVWHGSTYRLENTLNYGMERVWGMAARAGCHSIAIAYDEGSIMVAMGRDEPAMSLDSSGKLMWAKHTEVKQANLALLESQASTDGGDAGAAAAAVIKDGEPLPLAAKDMGSCELYPQTLAHNPNGRFVVVCGDGEYVWGHDDSGTNGCSLRGRGFFFSFLPFFVHRYIIHTALSFRNKSFGSGLDFVWASTDSSEYAVRENTSTIKIFKNFKVGTVWFCFCFFVNKNPRRLW